MQPRFFGLQALGALRDDLAFVPRMLADAVGLHPLGLNVYGVKPGAAVAQGHPLDRSPPSCRTKFEKSCRRRWQL